MGGCLHRPTFVRDLLYLSDVGDPYGSVFLNPLLLDKISSFTVSPTLDCLCFEISRIRHSTLRPTYRLTPDAVASLLQFPLYRNEHPSEKKVRAAVRRRCADGAAQLILNCRSSDAYDSEISEFTEALIQLLTRGDVFGAHVNVHYKFFFSETTLRRLASIAPAIRGLSVGIGTAMPTFAYAIPGLGALIVRQGYCDIRKLKHLDNLKDLSIHCAELEKRFPVEIFANYLSIQEGCNSWSRWKRAKCRPLYFHEFVRAAGNLKRVELTLGARSTVFLDFTQGHWPNLREIVIDLHHECRVSRVVVIGESDSVKTLRITAKKMVRLSGIENLSSLRTLELRMTRGFADLQRSLQEIANPRLNLLVNGKSMFSYL